MSICESCVHNKFCEIYDNGYGNKVKSCRDYKSNKQTNFQWITQDEDTLARWLDSTFYTCDAGCSHCALKEKCLPEGKGYQGSAMWREWLKQESDKND